MEEVAMQQASALVCAGVMKENGQPWTYQICILVVGEYTF